MYSIGLDEHGNWFGLALYAYRGCNGQNGRESRIPLKAVLLATFGLLTPAHTCVDFSEVQNGQYNEFVRTESFLELVFVLSCMRTEDAIAEMAGNPEFLETILCN